MKFNKVILAGGSGFIGKNLISFFTKSEVENLIVLTRKETQKIKNINYIHWDGSTLDNWVDCLEDVDILINLTGKNIQCVFNEKNKQELISSRVNSVNILNQAIKKLKNPPKLFIQVSGLGYFGDAINLSDENTAKGIGFLSDLSNIWEKSFYDIQIKNTRKIVLRLGLAFGIKGGVLKYLSMITKMFLGGHIGNGSTIISWFYIKELNYIINHLYQNTDLSGTFNVCTPKSINNKNLMKTLRSVFKQPYCPPIPLFIFKFFAKLFKIESDLILLNQNCIPKRLIDSGYNFKYYNLKKTLNKLYFK